MADPYDDDPFDHSSHSQDRRGMRGMMERRMSGSSRSVGSNRRKNNPGGVPERGTRRSGSVGKDRISRATTGGGGTHHRRTHSTGRPRREKEKTTSREGKAVGVSSSKKPTTTSGGEKPRSRDKKEPRTGRRMSNERPRRRATSVEVPKTTRAQEGATTTRRRTSMDNRKSLSPGRARENEEKRRLKQPVERSPSPPPFRPAIRRGSLVNNQKRKPWNTAHIDNQDDHSDVHMSVGGFGDDDVPLPSTMNLMGALQGQGHRHGSPQLSQKDLMMNTLPSHEASPVPSPVIEHEDQFQAAKNAAAEAALFFEDNMPSSPELDKERLTVSKSEGRKERRSDDRKSRKEERGGGRKGMAEMDEEDVFGGSISDLRPQDSVSDLGKKSERGRNHRTTAEHDEDAVMQAEPHKKERKSNKDETREERKQRRRNDVRRKFLAQQAEEDALGESAPPDSSQKSRGKSDRLEDRTNRKQEGRDGHRSMADLDEQDLFTNTKPLADDMAGHKGSAAGTQEPNSLYQEPAQSRTVDIRKLPPPPLTGPSIDGNRREMSPPPSEGRGAMSDRPESTESDKGKGGEEDMDEINIGISLMSGSWLTLYKTLMKTTTDKIVAAMLKPEGKGIALHTLVWKAPPRLALMIMQKISLSGLQSMAEAQDGDGNTPLHLCCANWDVIEGTDNSSYSLDYLLLNHIREMAPRTLVLKNKEGDTPLHLLVSSPACGKHDNIPESSRASLIATATSQISEFVSVNQEQGLMKDASGATPLHVAIANHACEEVLNTLIRLVPTAANVKDDKGLLPIHYVAAFGGTPSAVVKELIRANPESIMANTANHDSPLHLCVSNAAKYLDSSQDDLDDETAKCINMIMGYDSTRNVNPSKCPLFHTNREQLTPLHCCALFDTPPQLTRSLMKHPLATEVASSTNNFGATPLHLAAAHANVTLSIATVQAIGIPEAALTQDRLKRTPLHVASQNPHCNGELIKTLADLSREAAGIQTQRGHLPIHLASQSQAREDVVRALVTAFPRGAETLNKSGNTPLHDAAKYRAVAGVVKVLLDANPDAVYIQNQYGNLPLHCATAYQAPAEVVSLLLQAWPDGASMQNKTQDAALHYAAMYATSSEALKPLIDAAPAAVLLLNSNGQSPIDRAKANNAPEEILELLEQSAKDWTEKATSDSWGAFTSDRNMSERAY